MKSKLFGMRLIFFLLGLVLLVLLVMLSACAPAVQAPASGLPRVLAAESFLADIAQNVAGQRVKVGTLVPLGVDPHEYQPSPQDTARLAQSQVLIVNGLGYEWWLQKTLANVGGGRQLVVATTGLTPVADPTGTHPGGDPHMWLDPTRVVRYVENVRDGLTGADPAGAAVYAANAQAYITSLNDLDRWIKGQVAQVPAEKRLLVTNHESLGYFAQSYGFRVVGTVIPGLSSEASPTAQQLASLIQAVKASGVPAIFLDVGANPDLAQQVAAETGTKVVSTLYLETLSAPDGPAPTYLGMMKYDVTQIVSALR